MKHEAVAGREAPTLEPGAEITWNLLFSIAWDSPDRRPFFDEPGEYIIRAEAYTSDGRFESEPVTIHVRAPEDAAGRRAVELIESLSDDDVQKLYDSGAAAFWDRDMAAIPAAVRELADSPTPYRAYARTSLTSAHMGAANRLLAETMVRKIDRLDEAEAHLEEAATLLADIEKIAPELAARAVELSEHRLDLHKKIKQERARQARLDRGRTKQ